MSMILAIASDASAATFRSLISFSTPIVSQFSRPPPVKHLLVCKLKRYRLVERERQTDERTAIQVYMQNNWQDCISDGAACDWTILLHDHLSNSSSTTGSHPPRVRFQTSWRRNLQKSRQISFISMPLSGGRRDMNL